MIFDKRYGLNTKNSKYFREIGQGDKINLSAERRGRQHEQAFHSKNMANLLTANQPWVSEILSPKISLLSTLD